MYTCYYGIKLLNTSTRQDKVQDPLGKGFKNTFMYIVVSLSVILKVKPENGLLN